MDRTVLHHCGLLLTLLCGMHVCVGMAQTSVIGRRPIDTYVLRDLVEGCGDFNQTLDQDAQGRILVGNSGCLARFDGAHWQAYNSDPAARYFNGMLARPDGRIFVTTERDFGLFEADDRGGLAWHSLLSSVDTSAVPFADFRFAVAGPDGVWLRWRPGLLLIREGRPALRIDSPANRAPFRVGTELWAAPAGRPLQRILVEGEQGRAEDIPGTESLAADEVMNASAQDPRKVYILMRSGQLWRFDGQRLHPLLDEATRQRWQERGPIAVLALRDGNIAIGFSRAAPIIVDPQGHLRESFEGSMAPDPVWALFEDREGSLWVAQNLVVRRIGRGGISSWGANDGVASVRELLRHQGRLYAAGGTGLTVLSEASTEQPARFTQVDPSVGQATSLTSVGPDLLFSSGRLRRLRLNRDSGELVEQRPLTIDGGVRVVRGSDHHPGRAYAARDGEFWVIHDVNRDEPRIERHSGLHGRSHTLVESGRNTIWLGAYEAGPFRLRLDDDGQLTGIDDYSEAPGRRDMGEVQVFAGREGPWFIGGDQIRRFDGEAFVPVPGLTAPENLGNEALWRLAEGTDGELWLRSNARTWVWRTQSDGSARWHLVSLRPLDDGLTTYWILPEAEQIWFARMDGIARLDRSDPGPPGELLPTLISGLADPADGRSLPWPRLDADASPWQRSPLPQGLRFQFALPSFQAGAVATQFRSRLLGMDADWSPWNTRAERSYTNLPDGDFRFQVQARDGLGREAALAELPLRVDPPWWRHPLARLLQVGALLALLIALYRWLLQRRERRLLATQAELERNVAERTAELTSSNTQLQVQAERLRQVDQLKSRFFDNVSHEFRTPLSLVLGPLDDVLRDARVRLGERTREHLEMANRNARRVLDLMVELMDVNRLEQGQLPLRRQALELGSFVERQLEGLAPLLERHGHAHELQLPESPAWVEADPVQIERCLGNLVSNAAKYTPRGGRVQIRLERIDDHHRLSVQDNGRGVAAAELPHVFDRFFRSAQTADGTGAGIGLALVREIVEAHGGQVGVHSELGQGSCFWWTLPAVAAPQDMQRAGPTASSQVPTDDLSGTVRQVEPVAESDPGHETPDGSPLVLLIDDHPDLLRRLRELIGERYRVLTASDGEAGMKLARSELPDVVVSDVMMPGIDGITLARRLRADPATEGQALLLLTARAGAAHAVEGLSAGADDYLGKPFDGAELLARIAALLAQRRRLYHQLQRDGTARPIEAPPLERWRERLLDLIRTNLGDSSYGIDQLAAAMHTDRSNLFRRAKAVTGLSPSELLREARLQRALELLQAGAGNVTEVAYAVGFESLSSFARAFRLRHGQAPSEILSAARASVSAVQL